MHLSCLTCQRKWALQPSLCFIFLSFYSALELEEGCVCGKAPGSSESMFCLCHLERVYEKEAKGIWLAKMIFRIELKSFETV